MRPTSLRRASAASALVLALGLAACGGGDDETAATTTTEAEATTTTTEAESTTTTEAEDTTTTTAGEEETTTTVDSTVSDAWHATAVEFRDDVDGQHDFDCPAGGPEALNVWGDGPFTDDSSVCTAGVFAGAITYEDGGTVTIVMTGPQDSFDAAEANGVTTQEYPAWPGSFNVVPEL